MLPDTLEIQISLLISGTPALTITVFTHGRDFTCLDTITVGQSGTTITKALHPRGLPPPTPRVPCLLCRWVSSQLQLPCLNAPYNHTSRQSPIPCQPLPSPNARIHPWPSYPHGYWDQSGTPWLRSHQLIRTSLWKSIYIYIFKHKIFAKPFSRAIGSKVWTAAICHLGSLFSFFDSRLLWFRGGRRAYVGCFAQRVPRWVIWIFMRLPELRSIHCSIIRSFLNFGVIA